MILSAIPNLLAARLLFATSLIFHIVFAVSGLGLSLMTVIAEWLWLKKKNPVYLELAKRWSKLIALFFTMGAVTGTAISFELGLLWPKFMALAGPIFGMAFSLEGFAFFTEGIFLGFYLYGWNRLSPRMHLFSGVMVAISTVLSGILITSANAWMNTPAGFDLVNGQALNIRPFAAILNPSTLPETVHVVLTAYQAVAFIFAGLHAWMLLKDPKSKLHRAAFGIALVIAAIASILTPFSGDMSAKHIANYQKVKLAALEGQWETQSGAPFRIFGWPDEKNERTTHAIEIPKFLSFLSYSDFNAEVQGLKEVPRGNRPPVVLVHSAFQVMWILGSIMMAAGIIGLWKFFKTKSIWIKRWYLWLVLIAAPMGFLALEAGWIVTEVGRQPWMIYNMMRTSEGVTPFPLVAAPLILFFLIFLSLFVLTVIFVQRSVKKDFVLEEIK